MLSQTLRNSQSWTGVIRVDVADSSSGQSNGLVWSTSHRTYPREGAPPMDGQYRPMHQVTIQVQRLVHQRRRAPMSASAKHCPSFSTSQQSSDAYVIVSSSICSSCSFQLSVGSATGLVAPLYTFAASLQLVYVLFLWREQVRGTLWFRCFLPPW